MPSQLRRVLPDTYVCYSMSLLDLVLLCDEQDLHRVVWNSMTALDPQAGRRGKVDAKWRIIENARIEPDV